MDWMTLSHLFLDINNFFEPVSKNALDLVLGDVSNSLNASGIFIEGSHSK